MNEWKKWTKNIIIILAYICSRFGFFFHFAHHLKQFSCLLISIIELRSCDSNNVHVFFAWISTLVVWLGELTHSRSRSTIHQRNNLDIFWMMYNNFQWIFISIFLYSFLCIKCSTLLLPLLQLLFVICWCAFFAYTFFLACISEAHKRTENEKQNLRKMEK